MSEKKQRPFQIRAKIDLGIVVQGENEEEAMRNAGKLIREVLKRDLSPHGRNLEISVDVNEAKLATPRKASESS